MRVILTGSSGRIGRAIFASLSREHEVIGLDRHVFSTTHIIGDCADEALMSRVVDGADAVVHTAGPHAPHVGLVSDAEFERVNIAATAMLYRLAKQAGARRFLYTSTTALYGDAVVPGQCTWIDETVEPLPKSIYHRTKMAAEQALADAAHSDCPVRVLRMSRCFPEAASEMALYRLHRGVDARDVGEGHRLALTHKGAPFERFILSGSTPFKREDCPQLAHNAQPVVRQRAPDLAVQYDARGWLMPQRIDRVYDSSAAQEQLGWKPRWNWCEVMAQHDRQDLEVLHENSAIERREE